MKNIQWKVSWSQTNIFFLNNQINFLYPNLLLSKIFFSFGILQMLLEK